MDIKIFERELQSLRAAGYNPIGVSIHFEKPEFIFETEEEADKAFEAFDRTANKMNVWDCHWTAKEEIGKNKNVIWLNKQNTNEIQEKSLEELPVKIINSSKNPLPAYETINSAGMDLRCNTGGRVIIEPFERLIVPTGISIELPVGYEAQIRPRSGLAMKHGITVLNSPGTIDADYRGEVKVLLINQSRRPFLVTDGDRIAQMVIAKYERVKWQETETLSETERGSGGFGSTDV